jgi:hypothetical protein
LHLNSASEHLKNYYIFLHRDITIEITGLGILDWLVSSVTTWIVGIFNDQIVSSLDSHLKQYISGILPFVDPSKFFE